MRVCAYPIVLSCIAVPHPNPSPACGRGALQIKQQRGAALITVLLIVAMATVIAAFMAQQQGFWQLEYENGRDRAQSRYIAEAGVDWARAVLADDKVSNDYDHAREMWAMKLPAIPVEDGEVLGSIVDQQGLFNLNNLVRNGAVSAADLARLQKLLSSLSLPPELALALADWMDADNVTMENGGAEDGYYLQLPKPYRAANRPLSELSELLWVQGFDAQIIKRLSGFVAVLPEHTPINVNFATAEVLAAVIDGLPLQEARQIVSERKDHPFKTVAEFQQKLPPNVGQNAAAELTVSSKYFLVEGHAVQGQGEFFAQALLLRQNIWATVERQSVQ
ncbi:MAG: type II secretion system minor pseudopilin GspK [Sideroxydans sp.]|nr:type II secretion system minor pseudopilin GspK [Sideroxydans sp.]